MKRYLYVLAGLALAATLASCEKDKYGTDAGNDSTPNVVLKAFSAELPNDPDCDVVVRFRSEQCHNRCVLSGRVEVTEGWAESF